jgi:hypothetical protein
MRTLIIEAMGLDEDLAEKAVRDSVKALSTVIPEIQSDTLKIEPHDDIRGVFCGVRIDSSPLTENSKLLTAAVKNLVTYLCQPAKVDLRLSLELLQDEKG